MSRRRTSWSRFLSAAGCATPWKVCRLRGAAARTVSPSPIRSFRRSRVSLMKHSWPESDPTLLELPTRRLWRFLMRSSAQLDNIAERSLCESPGKFPKNNGADRAGITSETPEVVLYFLQQMFHTFGLSRRLVWPACVVRRGPPCSQSPPSFTLVVSHAVRKVGGMRVEEITLRKLQMRLKAPFETSFGATDNRTLLLVEMRADGVTGWSEITAMETPVFSAETVSTATVVIREVLAPAVLGSNFTSASEMREAFSQVRGHEMARAGLENALWDIEAQQKKIPLAKLLGGARNEIPCGVSIGLQASPDVLREKVAVAVAAGYQRIKLKIKPGKDLDFVRAIRKAFPEIRLSVDANSAYTL